MIISEKYFIYINILIGIIYLLFIIVGYIKGLLYEIVSLIYTGFSILVAWFAAPVLASLYPLIKLEEINKEAGLINKFVNVDSIADFLIYFVIIFLALKLVYVLVSLIVKAFNKVPVLGKINKLLGGLFGIINATLVTLAISLLLNLPIFKNGNEIREKTYLKHISEVTSKINNTIIENINLEDYIVDSSFDVEGARQVLKTWLESLNNND